MNRRRLSLSLIAVAIIAGTLAFSTNRPHGYLVAGEFDVTPILEPAPRKGDPRYESDRHIFRATRKLVGTPRWMLATNDVDTSVPALLRDYSCSVGTVLTPENSPRLVTLVQRAAVDTGDQTGKAKEFYRRERPFVTDHGKICQAPSELYDGAHHRMSYDYPSGHTTLGWTWALILSNLAPDRAQRILERGRAYGDSRYVCGAHNESAVEAGMRSASATMAVVQTKPAFQADLKAAREELDKVRATGSQPSGCDDEAALIGQRVMPKLN